LLKRGTALLAVLGISALVSWPQAMAQSVHHVSVPRVGASSLSVQRPAVAPPPTTVQVQPVNYTVTVTDAGSSTNFQGQAFNPNTNNAAIYPISLQYANENYLPLALLAGAAGDKVQAVDSDLFWTSTEIPFPQRLSSGAVIVTNPPNVSAATATVAPDEIYVDGQDATLPGDVFSTGTGSVPVFLNLDGLTYVSVGYAEEALGVFVLRNTSGTAINIEPNTTVIPSAWQALDDPTGGGGPASATNTSPVTIAAGSHQPPAGTGTAAIPEPNNSPVNLYSPNQPVLFDPATYDVTWQGTDVANGGGSISVFDQVPFGLTVPTSDATMTTPVVSSSMQAATSTDKYDDQIYTVTGNGSGEVDYTITAKETVYAVDGRILDPWTIPPYDTSSAIYQRWANPSIDVGGRVQSTDPAIVAMAQQIVGTEQNPYLKAWLLFNWITKNITYSDTGSAAGGAAGGASQVLQSRQGICSDYADLYVAFLRDDGIPARVVSGWYYVGSQPSGSGWHSWVEFYIQGHGWLPADPTFGTPNSDAYFAQLNDNGHIPFFLSPAYFTLSGSAYTNTSITSTPDPVFTVDSASAPPISAPVPTLGLADPVTAAPKTLPYADVTATTLDRSAINAIYQAGYVMPGQDFYPLNPISRQDFVDWLLEAKSHSVIDSPQQAMAEAQAAGWFQHDPYAASAQPTDAITRAEIAILLQQQLHLHPVLLHTVADIHALPSATQAAIGAVLQTKVWQPFPARPADFYPTATLARSAAAALIAHVMAR